jgi:hypothetical protein
VACEQEVGCGDETNWAVKFPLTFRWQRQTSVSRLLTVRVLGRPTSVGVVVVVGERYKPATCTVSVLLDPAELHRASFRCMFRCSRIDVFCVHLSFSGLSRELFLPAAFLRLSVILFLVVYFFLISLFAFRFLSFPSFLPVALVAATIRSPAAACACASSSNVVEWSTGRAEAEARRQWRGGAVECEIASGFVICFYEAKY